MAQQTAPTEAVTIIEDTSIRPFRVEIPQDAADDLRSRIGATRWPPEELVEDRSQGVQLATIRALGHHWATDYNFRRLEARLNALPQFMTSIGGVGVHFLHVESQHEYALPLTSRFQVTAIGR